MVPLKPGSLEEILNDLDKFLTSIIFFAFLYLNLLNFYLNYLLNYFYLRKIFNDLKNIFKRYN